MLYVVARGAHQIYAVTLTGDATLLVGSGEQGGRDGDALESTLNYPNDLGFSPDGRYLDVNEIADNSSDGMLLAPTRIRRIEMPLR